jgi:hypothetical protein
VPREDCYIEHMAKRTRKPLISVYLDPELLTRFIEGAKADRRSLSAFASILIEEALSKKEGTDASQRSRKEVRRV